MDLLTTYTHHSELQVITALSLTSPIHILPQHPLSPLPACCVFNGSSLATASNSVDSSVSHSRVVTIRRIYRNWTLNWTVSQSESESLYDWRFTDNQFVLAPSPLRLTARYFFQFYTYDCSPYVTSSLARGWVCRLQLLLALATSIILRSESRRTHGHILRFQILVSPNLEIRSPYLYPPGTGWPSYTLKHWVFFPSSFTTRRATVDVIRTRLHTLEGQCAMPWSINSRCTEHETPPQQCLHFLLSNLLPRRHELFESSLMLRPTVSRPVLPEQSTHLAPTIRFPPLSNSRWHADAGRHPHERTGPPPTTTDGPRQPSHSRVRFPRDPRPHPTVSDSRLPPSSPPTTRRATVEALELASAWD
jgi:hypothetical protein